MGEFLTVYVALLDEGTAVWRPVAAEKVGPDLFRLLDCVPVDECWQFEPGEIVRCEARALSGGRAVWVARESSGTQS
jgi:hypothetical protein